MRGLKFLFGAWGQVIVAIVLVALTTVELVLWWTPNLRQIFIVSMEALYFAAYGIAATGLSVLWLDKRTPDPEQVGSPQREHGVGAESEPAPWYTNKELGKRSEYEALLDWAQKHYGVDVFSIELENAA